MNYFVKEAKYLDKYKIWIKFEDGKSAEIDFSNEFDGPVFEPLKDIDFFKKFIIEGHTIQWENGADMSPEYLYELAGSAQTPVS